MHQIRNITVLFILLLLYGCIKPYVPLIETNAKNKYVVSGRITDNEGWQEVDVSMSSPIESPEYLPVSKCQVKILDDKGNVFSLDEFAPGSYHAWIGQEYLVHGNSYKVKVTTPSGEELESGFDKMPAGPALDSVYYIIQDGTISSGFIHKIMQFYVDLYAEGNYSQYYKWEITETWEYHAAHAIEYYYNGTFNKVDPPDSTNYVCWITVPVKNIFTLSTKNLASNIYKEFPLHYIDGSSSRLGILYSMMVRQQALSEKAYNYWEQLRINSNEQGGLYEKQPLAIKGNMVNVSNPNKSVLGYFYAASESSRRYFYKDIQGIVLGFNKNCTEEGLGRNGWAEFSPPDYPVYYYFPVTWILLILTPGCVDCRMAGGKTVKPDFWP